MKKILLIAAALFAVGSAYAGSNKVVNGDFEAEGYKQSVPSGYTWDPWNKQNYLTELPGWTLQDDIWNGGIELLTGDDWLGDGIVRPDEDLNVLRFVGYNDDGWHSVTLTQVVEGLTPGTEYTLSYLVAANFPEGAAWTPDPGFGYNVAEVALDAENNIVAGKMLAGADLASDPQWENQSIDMFPVKGTFTAPADGKVFLEIYMNNNYGKDNKHDNLWMLVDMVNISSEADGAGVANVAIEENAPVEYFNLQGVRVANPENGIFVRRQGSKATKVVL